MSETGNHRDGARSGRVGRRRGLVLAAGATALAALAYAALAQGEQTAAVAPSGEITFLGKVVAPAMLELGSQVYARNCASCHGRNLEGQPDWKHRLANGRMPAPPHDASGHTWHHTDQELFKITSEGLAAVVPGYESDMPVFGGRLSDDEIAAVLSYIKSTWPERQRAFQTEVTKNASPGGNP